MATNIQQELLAALNLVYGAQVDPTQRINATKFVDNFKMHHPDCLAVSLMLLTKENSDHARHFGFHCLMYFVDNRWNELNKAQEAEFKQLLIQFLAQGTKPFDVETSFIKEKAAQLIAELAKKLWPEGWPELIDQLVQLTAIGPTQAELALITFRALSEELMIHIDASDARRKALVSAMTNSAETIVHTHVLRFLSTSQQMPPRITRVCLDCIASYAAWIPPCVLFKESQLVSHVGVMLGNPEYRANAIDIFQTIVNRKLPENESDAPFLDLCEKLIQFTNSIQTAPGSLTADYHFHLKLCRVLSSFGTEHLSIFKSPSRAPALLQYLSTLLQLAGHPSVNMFLHVVPVWVLIFRQMPYLLVEPAPTLDAAKQQLYQQRKPPPEGRNAVGAFLSNLAATAAHSYWPAHPDTVPYLNIDCSDEEAMRAMISTTRTQIISGLKCLAVHEPVLPFECAMQQLQQTLANYQEITGKNDTYFRSLECALFFLEQAIKSIPESAYQDPKYANLLTMMHTLSTSLCSLQANKHPLVQARLIYTLASFATFAKFHGEQIIPHFLQMFLSIFRAGPPPRETALLEVRRSLLSTIGKICEHSPYVLTIMEQLVQSASELIAQNLVTATERAHLYEFFTVISNLLPPDQQGSFLSSILVQPVEDFTNPAVLQLLDTSTAPLSFAQLVSSQEHRAKLLSLPAIFQTVFKRTKGTLGQAHPIFGHFTRIAQPLLASFHVSHACFMPGSAPGGGILATSGDEKWHNWLFTFRQTCYNLVKHLCQRQLIYTIPNLAESLNASLLSGTFSHLPPQVIRGLMRLVFRPLFHNCPASAYPQLVQTLTQRLVVQLMRGLDAAWTQIALRSESAEHSTVETKDEVDADAVLCEATRDVCDVVVDIIASPAPPEEAISEKTRIALRDPGVATYLIGALAMFLKFQDSRSCGRACGLLQRLFRSLYPEMHLETVLAQDAMTGCMTALSLPQNQDHSVALLGLAKDIFFHLGARSRTPQQILLNIPGINETKLNELRSKLVNKNDKEQRTIFRQFWLALKVGGAATGKATTRSMKNVTSRALRPHGAANPNASSSSWMADECFNGIASLFTEG